MIRNCCIRTIFAGGLTGIALSVGCSNKPAETSITKIERHQASEMEQLAHVGNFWISEQPTERDLIWMRDNEVTMVIDVRARDEDRGFDERAVVVSLGMRYNPAPLELDQDYTIRYFDFLRETMRTRRDVPTLIHGSSANRAAAVWMAYRVLDDKVPYSVALAEAQIAGLNEDAPRLIVDQYLMEKGVNIKPKGTAGDSSGTTVTAVDGPDEVIYEITEEKSAPDETDTRRD